MSPRSGVLFAALGLLTVGSLLVGLAGVKDLYAAAIPAGLILFAGLFVSRYLDQRAHDRNLRSQFQLNIGSLPPGFHSPQYISAISLPLDRKYLLYDVETGRCLGSVSGAQLRDVLRAHEDWGLGTNDFYIMPETLEEMARKGVHRELLALLEHPVEERGSIEVRWIEVQSDT